MLLKERAATADRGPTTNVHGQPIISYALVNVREAYGLDLAWLKDSDLDGFPDVTDAAPDRVGYRNGLD